MLKKLCLTFAILAFGLVMFSSCSGAKKEGSLYKAGTYTATQQGNNGPISVKVKVSSDKILSVEITSHKETPQISDGAINDLPGKIVEAQSTGIDTISGCTVSSTAILKAVSDALVKAGGDPAVFASANTTTTGKADDIEKTVDVLVIGAGGAGMAAGVEANQKGATVVILEKMSRVGGNTIMAGGALNAVDEGSETALANKDSVELHYQQTITGGDNQGDPALVRTLVENAWAGVKWLKDMGMQFLPGTFTVTGGLWPRAHKPVEPVGTGFFKTYNAYVKDHSGIEVMLDTRATKLLTENGKVTGAVATGKTGNTITIHATKGVVVATGGFAANVTLREKYNTSGKWPSLENLKTTNPPSSTGDGIAMLQDVGADFLQMENIQLLPLGDPETGSLSGNIELDVERRIFINKEGKRFVNEGGRRDDMTLALLKQPDNYMWIVLDSHCYPTGEEKNNFNESANELVAQNRAVKADSLEELAKKMNVPYENLKAALDDFNLHVADKTTDSFGRTLYSTPIDTPPYYAAGRVPTVHHTMGGVKINTKAQVLDKGGNPIPGLYAAGEVTGGIHGTNRLGGNALTDTVVFGRIAGDGASGVQ